MGNEEVNCDITDERDKPSIFYMLHASPVLANRGNKVHLL